jgi:hypothetical protein
MLEEPSEGNECSAAHDAGCLAKECRKYMDDLHDWTDPIDQLAISVSIFFKLLRFVSEYPNDLIGGSATFKLVGEVVLGEVDPSLFGVFMQCVIEDELERGRRRTGRGGRSHRAKGENPMGSR